MATQVALPPNQTSSNLPTHSDIYSNVKDHYGKTAQNGNDANYGHAVATAFGYSPQELSNVPAESNLGLSCGNPFAIANLREGETVIDLGSGAGFDVFQAAKKVGESGRAIGVDMNADMISRAESIKTKSTTTSNKSNTTFVYSYITKINLPSSDADCIISNCVINLVPEPEKQLVFNEMYRLLKPGGRIAISDILLKKDLPEELKSDVALYVGCISGASKVEGYEMYLKEAGFKDTLIVSDNSDLNVYKTADTAGSAGLGCCGPTESKKTSSCGGSKSTKQKTEVADLDLNEWAASFKIYAVK